MEVLEFATGRSLLFEHARAFEEVSGEGWHSKCSDPIDQRVGKVIVYAPVKARVPEHQLEGRGHPRSGRFPEIADVPRPGTILRAGQPVLTILASGASAEMCRQRLRLRLKAVRKILRQWALDIEAEGRGGAIEPSG